MHTFNLGKIRGKVRDLAKQDGWTLNRIATESGVEYSSLWRFVREDTDLVGKSIEKLWPLLFGNQKPTQLIGAEKCKQ